MDRLHREKDFHEEQAVARAARWQDNAAWLHFADDEFLDHESWVREAWQMLGPLAGRQFLDYGCGHGMAAVVAARQGATVTAIELSHAYLCEAATRARVNGVSIHCVQADAQVLPFADASFDAVWGNAILHHLDLRQASRELRRVMRPGAVAVFCEPWGGNPILNWARQYLPYPGKDRTVDEQPLRRADLMTLRETFPQLVWQGFQTFSMIGRAVPWLRRLRWLTSLDHWLVTRFAFLKNACRYVVVCCRCD
jgi:ubiquinone/menaquinone biosynthesis C-methylase UbiE